MNNNKINRKIEANNLPILKIQNLSAWFHDVCVLKNINFEVKEKTVVALIGPSGCGKSTLIRCINRLHEEGHETRTKGEVILQQENIYGLHKDPVKIRRKIGMVFQKPNPFPTMNVFENVAIGLKLSGLKRRSFLKSAVKRALQQVALWDEVKDRMNAPSLSLSGGQQQRLCIARALAVRPPILLMDEPTSALDPIATARIEELIIKLKEEYTIIIVTHNMQQAARISDETGFLYMGTMIEYNKTSKIFTNPREAQTERYITGRFG